LNSILKQRHFKTIKEITMTIFLFVSGEVPQVLPVGLLHPLLPGVDRINFSSIEQKRARLDHLFG
jgi:hypothetical protein